MFVHAGARERLTRRRRQIPLADAAIPITREAPSFIHAEHCGDNANSISFKHPETAPRLHSPQTDGAVVRGGEQAQPIRAQLNGPDCIPVPAMPAGSHQNRVLPLMTQSQR